MAQPLCPVKKTKRLAGRSVNPKSHDWCTPPKYVEAVKEFFNGSIGLDPCSNGMSIVDADTEFMLPDRDGLAETWDYRTIYVNPPYGADRNRGTSIKDWLCKVSETRRKYGSEILALIPVATNTSHWKKYIFGNADALCFLYDTRLKFLIDGSTDNKGAPMACAMIYWGNRIQEFHELFGRYGAVMDIKKKETGYENLARMD